MKRRTFLASSAAVTMAGLNHSSRNADAATPEPAGLARTRMIAARVKAVLARLDHDGRAKLQFPFQREAFATAVHFKGGLRGDVDMVGERYGDAVWSNFPVSDVPRPGLRLGALDGEGQQAVFDLLQALLSLAGYKKVLEIMGSDQALAESCTPYASGRDAYTLAIFGEPSDVAPWMVQFGGHHLALNVAMMGGRGVLAPVLTGCLPAIYTVGGTPVRALWAENDKAFTLLASLDATQRERAAIDHPVSTLAMGPGCDGKTIQLQGLPASAMNEEQQDMLFGLVREWAGLLNADHAAPHLQAIKADLADTRFSWSGPTTHTPNRNGASYFRIHGPALFIEFSPQEPGGDLTMHAHTIYRDPSNAYGHALA